MTSDQLSVDSLLLAHFFLRAPEVISSHGQIWFQADRRGKFTNAFFFPTHGKQDKSEVIVCLSVVGIDSQSLLVLIDGFRKLPLLRELNTKVCVHEGILGR